MPLVVLGLALSVLAACARGETAGPTPEVAVMTADIPPSFKFVGEEVTATMTRQGEISLLSRWPTPLLIELQYVAGPGTYPLGVSYRVPGGFARYGTFLTHASGAAGSVTISEMSAARLAGTFEFVAQESTHQLAVENGRFSIPGDFGRDVTVDPGEWSTFSWTLDEVPWNAAVIDVDSVPDSGTLSVAAGNNIYRLDMLLGEWFGAGTYPVFVDATRTLRLQENRAGEYARWGGPGSTSSGFVTITQVTEDRVRGTLSANLGPALALPGSGRVQLNAEFDLGISFPD